jgi:beta-glucanase (GH16 family)
MKKHTYILLFFLLLFLPTEAQEYELVWSEEFDYVGSVNTDDWNFEHGFVRNHEHQWYQEDNAYVRDGCLIIVGRHEQVANPGYVKPDENTPQHRRTDWRRSREFAEYTSASINTRGKHEWLYGRFEVCARIPTAHGSWPAIWTLGTERPWPMNGEIDIMEFYRIKGVPHILANAAWAREPNRPIWNTGAFSYSLFTDQDSLWAEKFHVWRMDWDKDSLRLYLDDKLLNVQSCDVNADGFYPFRQPHYLLLNLAIGGDNGGEPAPEEYPIRYEIEYIRIYQLKNK